MASNEPMEDRHSVHAVEVRQNIAEDSTWSSRIWLNGVFDGHAGSACAESIRLMLHRYCINALLDSDAFGSLPVRYDLDPV
jgi:serine/threonine protein phosphatase PrpC